MQERNIVRIYNRDYLDNISKIYMSGNIKKARKFLEEYRLEYTGEHYVFKAYDASISGSEGNIDGAISIFEDIVYLNNYRVKDIDYYNFACLLIEKERYEEAFEILNKINIKYLINNTKVTYKNFTRMIMFLKKQLHIDNDSFSLEYYSDRQLYDYSNECAKYHIYEKHNIVDENNYGLYMDYEQFCKLYDLINNALLLSEKTFEFSSGDIYYFKIPNVGINYYTGEVVNFLKVWTNFHEKQILTMFPLSEIKNSSAIINEIKTEKTPEYFSEKIRQRVSQVDKFNKKYNL